MGTDAIAIANSEDPDQTAPFGSSLIYVCTVSLDLSVPIYRSFSVTSESVIAECRLIGTANNRIIYAMAICCIM